MTEEKPEGDWLKVRSLGSDDPMFELDGIKHVVVCNQNSKNFIRLAAFLKKLAGKNYFPLRYMMLSLSVAYLILKASQINPSTRIEIYNRFVKCIKGCVKTIAVVKPDAKERGKETAKERRKIFGDTQSTISSHKRNPPPMHFQCPKCEGPGEGSTKKKYKERKQWWRNLTNWIRKNEKSDGTNPLRDYLTRPKDQGGCGLEIVDYNIDALWKEYSTSEFNNKKKKYRKHPRKGEKIKSLIAENTKTDLENEGSTAPDIPTDDPALKDKAEDTLIYIRTFRTVRPKFDDSDTPREDTFKEVARMNNTTEWEKIRDLVYKYCDDNEMDIDATLGSKEHKIKSASDDHDEHTDDSNDKSSHAPI
tara:strand:+ start:506 stop:1591 length:1086 start_codon:yes stop_codon:yes gene_type:complete